jgi:hypothetical protein
MESGNRTAEQIIKPLEFLMSRLDDVAPERYPSHSVRIICAAAMEEYKTQQCEALQSENERLKEEANKAIFEMLVEKGRNVQSEKENTRLLERVKELTEALSQARQFAGFIGDFRSESIARIIDKALNPKE